MTNIQQNQANTTIDHMDEHWRRALQEALSRAEYNPFKLWTITDEESGQSQQIRVITIKLGDHALAAVPERHLVASGSDFLEVTQALTGAMLDDLGIEQARVASTCSIPFDLDGQCIRPTNTPRPQTNRIVKERDLKTPMNDNVAGLTVTPNDNLFLDAAHDLELSSTDDDPNDDFQQSLIF